MKNILTILLIFVSSPLFAKKVAFLGDSISTGGAAHPYLALEADRFHKIFTGKVKIQPDDNYQKALQSLGYEHIGSDSPTRLELSRREFFNAFNWAKDSLFHRLSIEYLDAEEYSWSYLLAKRLGYKGEDILIAAKDGESSKHIMRQADRLLDASSGQLPEKIFIFFTGNDLCGPSLEWVTSSQSFKSNIESGIRYLLRNGKSAPAGTQIYLVNPLGSLQLFSSSSIKNKSIPFYGTQISCENLQTNQFAIPAETNIGSESDPEKMLSYLLFYNFIGHSPARYCSSLFSVAKDTDARLELSKRIEGYRRGLKELVEKFTKEIGSEISFHHIDSTGSLLFEADDIANDCFHLSLYGQHKVAAAVLGELE